MQQFSVGAAAKDVCPAGGSSAIAAANVIMVAGGGSVNQFGTVKQIDLGTAIVSTRAGEICCRIIWQIASHLGGNISCLR